MWWLDVCLSSPANCMRPGAMSVLLRLCREHPAQCPAHSRYSIHIRWHMNKWMNEWVGMHLYSGVLAGKLVVRGIFKSHCIRKLNTDLWRETSNKLWKCLKKELKQRLFPLFLITFYCEILSPASLYFLGNICSPLQASNMILAVLSKTRPFIRKIYIFLTFTSINRKVIQLGFQ